MINSINERILTVSVEEFEKATREFAEDIIKSRAVYADLPSMSCFTCIVETLFTLYRERNLIHNTFVTSTEEYNRND